MQCVYLDNAATTKPLPEVVRVMNDALSENYGNPSSPHKLGLEAEKLVERAREEVAAVIGADNSEIAFVSGGTEGNNLALRGGAQFLKRRGRHIITTAVEHPSVSVTCEALEEEGFELTVVPVDSSGAVSVEAIEDSLRDDTVLVSVMYVNNEVGTIQPVAEIGKLLADRPNTFYHIDAIQALGKVPVDVHSLKADFVTFSGHKVHGPKGVGAVYIRNRDRLTSQLTGGGQERNIRSGTENVPGIAGFGAAVAHLSLEDASKVKQLKVMLARGISEIEGAVVNGPAAEEGAPHILNVGFPGVRGEVLVHALEAHGICVSTGAACSTRKTVTSPVLQAMGKSQEIAEGSIRISLSRFTTEEEIEYTIDRLKQTVRQLRQFQRR